MAKAVFANARISGITSVIASEKRFIDNEIELYGGEQKQIKRLKQMMGLNERYVVDDKTTTADLCQEAAQQLIDGMNLQKEVIDAVVFVSQTPDYFLPATAACLHGRLNLSKNCLAFDVNLGCSGYVYGLWLSFVMIASHSARNILLLAGDTISKLVNVRDRSTAPVFGDAGSATLIQESVQETRSWFSLQTDGKGFDNIIVPAGGMRKVKSSETGKEKKCEDGNTRSEDNLHMHGANVFNFAITEIPPHVEDILLFAGKAKSDVDYFVFHQANKFIIENIASGLGIPIEKAPCKTVEKYGNQSSASIPVTLCDALHNQLTSEPRTLLLTGFGVGLSWASCLIEMDKIRINEVQFFKGVK